MTMIEYIPISKLTLLKNNPRTITKDQFAKLCKSLSDDPDFFSKRPCLVNKTCEYPTLPPETTIDINIHERKDTYTVYAGNQRVRAAKKLGYKEVPCIIDVDLDQEIIKSRIAKDNLNYGTWDYDILGNEFEIDMLLDAGFTQNMLDGAFDPIVDVEGEIPEKKEKKQKECPSCGHFF